MPGKHNQETHGDGTGQAVADKLKLASRIELKPAEKLVASDRVKRSSNANITNVGMLAATQGPDGFRLRLGIVFNEDAGKWRGSNSGGTLSMDGKDVDRVVADLERVDAEATDRAKLMKKQIAEFDRLADAAEDPSRDLADRAEADRQLDLLGEEMGDRDQVVAEGVIPAGEWGDLAYSTYLVDDGVGGRWGLDLAVRPRDAGPDWEPREADSLELDKPTLKRLLAQLREMRTHEPASPRRSATVKEGPIAMPILKATAKTDDIRRTDPLPYARSWALDDIQILRAADGHSDGRTVEAYAAVFDTPTEITDQHGHYNEVISRTAFNRQIGLGIERVGVFYHHGLTIHGTPSDLGSVPIGSPLEIRADGKGLRTVTRFNRSPLADSVLEAIRAGDIKGYSFRGRIFKSNPSRVPKSRGGSLPTITRTELGLTEYGPTPTPAYADAGILAVRALQMLASATSLPNQAAPFATPDLGRGAEDQPPRHSDRLQRAARLRAQAQFLGVTR